ncbi:hypothetical protein OESDEN_02877 [Oesophagostomum dentatum]|uniref:Uncharacterized protein n=1 Tax=Oesophagostomum dentatum TaxID=61180 RepID=A0A0B1TP66_OESDE|nr:hypothetical protein OESDEN_02877 [Oesophagostomum dentatum]
MYPSISRLDDPPPYPAQNDAALPPTYKDSIKGVDGTVVDKADLEPFVPLYPFYPQLPPNEKTGADKF